MNSGWFAQFFTQYIEALDRNALLQHVQAHMQPWTRLRKNAAKRHIFLSLHHRGVAYGLPLAHCIDHDSERAHIWSDAMTPYLQIWCNLAIEVDSIMRAGLRKGDISSWLLSIFALLVEQDELAQRLFLASMQKTADKSLLAKSLRIIETGLNKKRLAAANPLLGLPLRNAFVYSDARMFTRIALTLADKERIDEPTLEKLRAFFWKERHRQVIALGAMNAVSAELNPSFIKTARQQLGQLGLSRKQVHELRSRLGHPMTAEEVVEEIQGHREAGYLLEQLAIAAMIDADYDPNEQAFMAQVASLLGVPKPALQRIEKRVWHFVMAHREDYDRYIETHFYGKFGARVEKYLSKLVQSNLGAVVTEVRQTRELAALLTRAAAGKQLSSAEKKRMQEQLLDIVRTVPSLAIFALPGGALLLPIVLKLLPWDLRPTAFRK